MASPAPLDILGTVRREMTRYCQTRSLYALAKASGVDYPVAWRILSEGRAASFANVEKLLVFFGYRLTKDDRADRSRTTASKPSRRPTTRRKV